ncbi:hypothetical protein DFH27DRAFT_606799 [Peziza echinospora]|nr:hypothetical protein DFH27DRAFT_606799 [Peziza echinospora]
MATSQPQIGERKKCIVVALGGAQKVRDHSAPLWEALNTKADVVFVEDIDNFLPYMSKEMRPKIHSVILGDSELYEDWESQDSEGREPNAAMLKEYTKTGGKVIMCSLFVKGINHDPASFEKFMLECWGIKCFFRGNICTRWEMRLEREGSGGKPNYHARRNNSYICQPSFKSTIERMEAASLQLHSIKNETTTPDKYTHTYYNSQNDEYRWAVACWHEFKLRAPYPGTIGYFGDLNCGLDTIEMILMICDDRDPYDADKRSTALRIAR